VVPTWVTLSPSSFILSQDCKYYNILCYCTNEQAEIIDLETGNKINELVFPKKEVNNAIR
jgi:hypothetical protein